MSLTEHKPDNGDGAAGLGSLVVMSTDWPEIARGGSPYGACRDQTTRSFPGRAGAGPGFRGVKVGGTGEDTPSYCLWRDQTGWALSWGGAQEGDSETSAYSQGCRDPLHSPPG